jgi:hypothetical protein
MGHQGHGYVVEQPLTQRLKNRQVDVLLHIKTNLQIIHNDSRNFTCAQAQPAWPSNTPSSIPRVCRQVAALRRSSMGALAGSWLLSNPITDDTFLPSNSGT